MKRFMVWESDSYSICAEARMHVRMESEYSSFRIQLYFDRETYGIVLSIRGVGFQPVALKMTGWKPIPLLVA